MGEYKIEPGSLPIDTRVSYTDDEDRPATGVIIGYQQWGYKTSYRIRPDGRAIADYIYRCRENVRAI